ncbi:unnamed protein product [Allacma fusca]|uniref:Transmembrane protein 53 n=1 Tax=Allacma fusca TaxID=39272 RepID=A0A8J2PUF2_9HEXA|nr:unnamed protein product [Allacma fusca]
MILAERLRMILPKAGKVLQNGNPMFRKALTPLMILHGVTPQQPNRTLTNKTLTKSIELVTNSTKEIKVNAANPLQLQVDKTLGSDEVRPLTILLCWMMSQKKHVLKYAKFYLDQGFDVLTVSITPWQLLWPVTGSQVIAKDILSFVSLNDQYKTTMLHGFSVGGYLWGEVLNLMMQDQQKYQPFIDRIVGQIWDSVVDFEGIPTGLPKAVFPRQQVLQSSLEKYVTYHMARFHETATKHYLQSSRQYHDNIVRAPALFFCSLDDPVGSKAGIQKVIDKWELNGIKVYLKAWESSPHVSHLHHHPEEYQQEMKAFLEKLGLVPYPEKFHQKIKSRSRS